MQTLLLSLCCTLSFLLWVPSQGHLCLFLQSDFDRASPLQKTFETKFWTVLISLTSHPHEPPPTSQRILNAFESHHSFMRWDYAVSVNRWTIEYSGKWLLPGILTRNLSFCQVMTPFSISSKKKIYILIPLTLHFSFGKYFFLIKFHSDTKYLWQSTIFQSEYTISFAFLTGHNPKITNMPYKI